MLGCAAMNSMALPGPETVDGGVRSSDQAVCKVLLDAGHVHYAGVDVSVRVVLLFEYPRFLCFTHEVLWRWGFRFAGFCERLHRSKGSPASLEAGRIL